MTNGFLVPVPHERLHGTISILEHPSNHRMSKQLASELVVQLSADLHLHHTSKWCKQSLLNPSYLGFISSHVPQTDS